MLPKCLYSSRELCTSTLTWSMWLLGTARANLVFFPQPEDSLKKRPFSATIFALLSPMQSQKNLRLAKTWKMLSVEWNPRSCRRSSCPLLAVPRPPPSSAIAPTGIAEIGGHPGLNASQTQIQGPPRYRCPLLLHPSKDVLSHTDRHHHGSTHAIASLQKFDHSLSVPKSSGMGTLGSTRAVCSAELSEGINSMFRYYAVSAICYVYLSDVDTDSGKMWDAFRRSRWHSRGWTLQELIASRFVMFYSKESPPGLRPHYSYPTRPHDDPRHSHGDHSQPRHPRASLYFSWTLLGARAAHPGMAMQGSQSLSGQTQTTHIFMTPQTGPSVKKPKPGVLGSNGSIMAMGPDGSIISDPATIGGGGFPATNNLGQRLCRQCGPAGRYKDGKCVEKWGSSPEGPGTVCDRCRKKMKRVERRGTLDSMSLDAHLHNQPVAIHPLGIPQAAPGLYTNGCSLHSGSDRSVHRTDTLPTYPSHSSCAPGLNGLSSSGVYSRQDRDQDYERENGASPYHRSSHRSHTPLSIAMLPQDDDYDRWRHPSSAHKPNGSMNGHARSSSSLSVNRSLRPKPTAATKNTGSSSSRG
ncbi:uncharacterized protein BXZ73DRAFT_107143 [Epithele typhae]|uniref:uncharacterized protein n=1 Tax=Epithele typhae TaxID=378194 RepID=UPI0020080F5B|nr:uncharacterized protein BXZ73DRAFT_107143 [Epithele typhae]KAH9912906.1 hypothetical protein BXZ73DRAFT_107143 [Epithele typhae]